MECGSESGEAIHTVATLNLGYRLEVLAYRVNLDVTEPSSPGRTEVRNDVVDIAPVTALEVGECAPTRRNDVLEPSDSLEQVCELFIGVFGRSNTGTDLFDPERPLPGRSSRLVDFVDHTPKPLLPSLRRARSSMKQVRDPEGALLLLELWFVHSGQGMTDLALPAEGLKVAVPPDQVEDRAFISKTAGAEASEDDISHEQLGFSR